MRHTNNETGRALSPLKVLLLVMTVFLMTACCAISSKPVPLHKFVDELRVELTKTKAITRLTVTQVATGQGEELLRSEQDAQCTSDPILLFLGGDLLFTLKASVKGQAGMSLTSSPAPTVEISGTDEHELKWKVSPISLSNLANAIFAEDIKTIQSIRESEDSEKEIETVETKKYKAELLKEAWELREKLKLVTKNLITTWQKPTSCPRP